MILFMEDWDYYPNAVVHTDTKNVSFLRYAKVLDKMGVKNNAWFLSLLNPDLRYIKDPFDIENLSSEEMAMINEEVRWNPWYFFREIARFGARSGGDGIPFEGHRGNLSFLWSFFNHIDFILIMIRQRGKSGTTEMLHNYLMHIAAEKTKIQVVNKDAPTANSALGKIKENRDELPEYMSLYDEKADANNQTFLTCKALSNRLNMSVARASKKGADKVARGLTVPVIQFEEFTTCDNLHVIVPAASPAALRARDDARKAGGFYGTMFTSTAGRTDTPEGAFAYRLAKGAAPWADAYYDAENVKDLTKILMKAATRDRVIINGTFNHRQTGRTDAWLKKAIVESESEGAVMLMDFFNKWVNASTESPLSKAMISRLLDAKRPNEFEEITDEKYLMRWHYSRSDYKQILEKDHHIIGLDTSDSFGEDANCLYFINSRTGETAMLCVVSETDNLLFAKFIARILIDYPKTTLVPERKSSFPTMLDIIQAELRAVGIYVFNRVFNAFFQDPETIRGFELRDIKSDRPVDEVLYTKNRKMFGFVTTGKSRPELYDLNLKPCLNTIAHILKDEILIEEITSLEKKNGRISHPDTGNDDTVVAMLLAYWFLKYGRNLDFYGIDKDMVLSDIEYYQVESDSDEMKIKQKEEESIRVETQRRYKLLFNQAKENYVNATTLADSLRYEAKMKLYRDMLSESGGESINLDGILAESDNNSKKNKAKLRQKRINEALSKRNRLTQF